MKISNKKKLIIDKIKDYYDYMLSPNLIHRDFLQAQEELLEGLKKTNHNSFLDESAFLDEVKSDSARFGFENADDFDDELVLDCHDLAITSLLEKEIPKKIRELKKDIKRQQDF